MEEKLSDTMVKSNKPLWRSFLTKDSLVLPCARL